MPQSAGVIGAGVIGVGLLGSAVCRRLASRGFAVKGFDPGPAAPVPVPLAGSNAALASDCSTLILCLPHSGITAAVLEEVRPSLEPGALIIDMTTGDPAEMAAFGGRLANLGCGYLDATVAGSSRQVEAGEGVILAGGSYEDFQRASSVFEALSAKTFHTGACGSGARLKLVVNLVLGLNRAVFAEGLAFAEACGIDPALAVEILKATPAYSRVMDVKGQKMLQRDYRPEARLRQHHKDVRLILEEGRRTGAALPFSEVHDGVLTAAEEAGCAELDNSAVIEVLRRGIL